MTPQERLNLHLVVTDPTRTGARFPVSPHLRPEPQPEMVRVAIIQRNDACEGHKPPCLARYLVADVVTIDFALASVVSGDA